MLPKKNRLKKKKDFERVFKEGKGFKEDFLFLKLAKNNLNISRFGFAVGQKISKKAVLRNKIKRMLRELVKARLPKIKIGFDGILVALGPVPGGLETRDYKEMEDSVGKLFKKAKLF